jgi:hypothetical protein
MNTNIDIIFDNDNINHDQALINYLKLYDFDSNLDVCLLPIKVKSKITTINDSLVFSKYIDRPRVLKRVKKEYKQMGIIK